MTPTNRNESVRSADEDEVCERSTNVDGGESSGNRFGRRALRRGLLLFGTAVGVRVGVTLLRRRRRPEREFTQIEFDADPAEQ